MELRISDCGFPQIVAFDLKNKQIVYGAQSIMQWAIDRGLLEENGSFMVFSLDEMIASLVALNKQYPDYSLTWVHGTVIHAKFLREKDDYYQSLG